MGLENQINEDIKSAMLSREKRKLDALRAVKAAILIAKTDKGGQGSFTEAEGLKILQKLVKQRKESSEIYKGQGRNDLAEEELFQASVIQEYLPEQLSESEIREEVKKVIIETGASGTKDMGKVMGASVVKLAGRADNKLISAVVKELLS